MKSYETFLKETVKVVRTLQSFQIPGFVKKFVNFEEMFWRISRRIPERIRGNNPEPTAGEIAAKIIRKFQETIPGVTGETMVGIHWRFSKGIFWDFFVRISRELSEEIFVQISNRILGGNFWRIPKGFSKRIPGKTFDESLAETSKGIYYDFLK